MSFPIDWNEWQKEWKEWRQTERLAKAVHANFPRKNFLADDVLGFYRVNGQTVELSEVTFPDFGSKSIESKSRYVGITWMGDNGECVNGGLAESFDELKSLLNAGRPK